MFEHTQRNKQVSNHKEDCGAQTKPKQSLYEQDRIKPNRKAMQVAATSSVTQADNKEEKPCHRVYDTEIRPA